MYFSENLAFFLINQYSQEIYVDIKGTIYKIISQPDAIIVHRMHTETNRDWLHIVPQPSLHSPLPARPQWPRRREQRTSTEQTRTQQDNHCFVHSVK